MRCNMFGTGRLLIVPVVFTAVVFGQTARAEEWEGVWADRCSNKRTFIELSKSFFNLGTIELECTPLGSRKLGARYVVDLSCGGEGGAQRMRAQIEVRDDKLKISGIQADLGTLHRCASGKPK